MQFVEYNRTGSVAVELDERPDAAPTYVLRYPAGGVAQASAAATRDAVDTTLSGASAAGATTVSVTLATSIAAGRKYLVGGSEASGGEQVTVRSVSATTVTLVRPLARAAASGATFVSTRVTMDVPALTKIARHYRAELTYLVSTAARPVAHVTFDVTRYSPVSRLQLEDVRASDPLFSKRLAAGVFWPALREDAWQMVLRRLAATKDPGALVGAVDLTSAHAYACRYLAAETAGEEHAPYRDKLAERFVQEFDSSASAAAFDDDQDQAIEKHERWLRSIPVVRG